MKKLFFLLAVVVILALLFSSCKKDDDDFVPYIPPQTDTTVVVVDNFDYNADMHLYSFVLGSTHLKSTAADSSSVQFVKFVSYSSSDMVMQDSIAVTYGQRNVHEVKVYSEGQNVAVNAPYVDTSNVQRYWNPEGTQVYSNSVAWKPAGWYGMADGCASIVDNNLNSRWESNRDDGRDTVIVVLNLRNTYTADSVRLYLGEYKQDFDLFISTDSLDWVLIGTETHPDIPIYLGN